MSDGVARQLTTAEVAVALRRHLPAGAPEVTRVAGSVGNQDFVVRAARGDVIVKIGDRRELTAEAWACERAARAGVSSPAVVALDLDPRLDTGTDVALLVLRRFPGRAVGAGADDSALVEAGRQLRLLHAVTLDGYGSLTAATPGGWPAGSTGSSQQWSDVLAAAQEGLPELVDAGVVDDPLARSVVDALDRHASAVAFTGRGSLLHGDLKPAHVFALDGRYVGLIDFGDAMVGDPLWDLARASMAGDRQLALLLEGYGGHPGPAARTRLAAYRLLWNARALVYEHRAGGDWFEAYRDGVRADLRVLEVEHRRR